MVYSASISKSAYTYISVCVYFFFSMEKGNSKEHSSAVDTWRQGSCSKGRSNNARCKSDKGENCEGRQLKRKEDCTVTVLWKTNEERVTLCTKKHVWILISKSFNRFWFSKKGLYGYYKHGSNYPSTFSPDSRFWEMKSEKCLEAIAVNELRERRGGWSGKFGMKVHQKVTGCTDRLIKCLFFPKSRLRDWVLKVAFFLTFM